MEHNNNKRPFVHVRGGYQEFEIKECGTVCAYWLFGLYPERDTHSTAIDAAAQVIEFGGFQVTRKQAVDQTGEDWSRPFEVVVLEDAARKLQIQVFQYYDRDQEIPADGLLSRLERFHQTLGTLTPPLVCGPVWRHPVGKQALKQAQTVHRRNVDRARDKARALLLPLWPSQEYLEERFVDADGLTYDDGEPLPHAKHCEVCGELFHQETINVSPTQLHQQKQERWHVRCCFWCWFEDALELFYWYTDPDTNPDSTDHRSNYTDQQLEICRVLEREHGQNLDNMALLFGRGGDQ